MNAARALLPGTFDPFTNGHRDLLRRAQALPLAVVVAVASGPRRPLFSASDRVSLIRRVLQEEEIPGPPEVISFDGLVVEAARRHGATVLLRGVRNAGDLARELQMAWANRVLAPEIETLLLPATAGLEHVSASLVREVARLGGSVDAWVSPSVAAELRRHLDFP